MNYDLVIVGAGIAGAAAALEAKCHGVERVLVTDYEHRLGGFTQELFETGEFASEADLMARAAELPCEFRYRTSVIGFFPGEDGHPHQIRLQGPGGSEQVTAERVLLCSGSLEKPREAYRIPGSRPEGVMTPLMAVNLLRRGHTPGKNVLAAGKGRLTAGAAELLRRSGIRIETLDSSLWTVSEIIGGRRLEGVKIRNMATGETRMHACDTLLFSQGRIPCTFYLKGGDVELDSRQAIVTDSQGRTNIAGVSAAGTCTAEGDDEHRASEEQARKAVRALLQEA